MLHTCHIWMCDGRDGWKQGRMTLAHSMAPNTILKCSQDSGVISVTIHCMIIDKATYIYVKPPTLTRVHCAHLATIGVHVRVSITFWKAFNHYISSCRSFSDHKKLLLKAGYRYTKPYLRKGWYSCRIEIITMLRVNRNANTAWILDKKKWSIMQNL